MKLPNRRNAHVNQAKLNRYLLSLEHAHGRHKAIFFRGFGFSANKSKVLARALLQHATKHDVAKIEDSAYGKRYVIDGILKRPTAETPQCGQSGSLRMAKLYRGL